MKRLTYLPQHQIPFSFVRRQGSSQADSPVSEDLPHLVQRALHPSFAYQLQALSHHF